MKNPQIDEFIAGQQDWKKDILMQLRAIMHEADPEIQEAFKWGAPTFEHNGQVTWIFTAENWVHVSFRQGILLDAPDGTWEEDETSLSKAKRTIKIRQGQTLDKNLLLKLIRQAVQNNISGKKVDFKTTKPGSKNFDLPHAYEAVLTEAGYADAFKARPYYQQKGWIEWIESAKTEKTRLERIDRMLIELKYDQYMPSKKDRKKA